MSENATPQNVTDVSEIEARSVLYIGTKMINAVPMNRGDYNNLRGWECPADENPDDEGYLVEYQDGGQRNHESFSGYISWSPKDVFERAYEPTNGLSFGLAIEALKRGYLVARAGWNGKGMFLLYVPGVITKLQAGSAYQRALEVTYGTDIAEKEIHVLPHIDMWTTDASGNRAFLPGWLASQTDKLATDWYLVQRNSLAEAPEAM